MTKEELEKEAEEFTDSKKSFWRQGRTCINSVKQAYIAGAEQREKRIAELEAQIEKMKKYGKLLQDICIVMGNNPYMVSVGLENRVKVLWDSSEEKEGLKMVEDIENRLLEIKHQDWAEITKWEIKENDRGRML